MKTTCLEPEITRMIETVTLKLRGYSSSGKSIVERVLQIFKKHSRSDIKEDEQIKIRSAITSAVKEGRPVNVSFLWALGGNARSMWKFIQSDLNLPRLGDFWAFAWLDMLDRKIKTVYSPGCRFIIVDEVPIIKLIPRWNQVQIEERRKALMPIRKMFLQIEVHDLPTFQGLLPVNPVTEIYPGEILAILLSRSDLEEAIDIAEMEVLYQDLYRTREKDWGKIRSIIPSELWDEAVATRMETARINQLRKETDWIGSELFGGELYVDGALTEKGRWCPRIWPETSTSPQHGGTTLKIGQGSFSVGVEIEDRLLKTHTPVYINPIEFGDTYQYKPFVFYWE
ncbi:MAG: hypothetical protein Q7K54_03865 [Candidatus Parcubacteria bacterium]|nr:hypothetical protein [Candidatus Parcubacteria bacterium]